MSARTEFEPLSWEEAEQNLRESLRGATASAAPRESNVLRAISPPWTSAADRCERLRTEIKHGREHLEQVRHDLAEIRARLEDWPTYEKSCGHNPLAYYTQSLLVNERIEQFLPDWLQRREEKLEALMKELDFLSQRRAAEAPARSFITAQAA